MCVANGPSLTDSFSRRMPAGNASNRRTPPPSKVRRDVDQDLVAQAGGQRLLAGGRAAQLYVQAARDGRAPGGWRWRCRR
jgi:hypothetical protein